MDARSSTWSCRARSSAARNRFVACAIDAVTSLPALALGLLWQPATPMDIAAALPATLYAAACTAAAGGLQVVAQKHTPAAEAGLIIALQCVFAALAGALFLADRLTPAAAFGCGLILLAVVMVEAGPVLLQRLKTRTA